MARGRARPWSALLCGVFAWGCVEAPAGPQPNIAVVVVDSLRLDRVASGEGSPTLDRLRAESVWFENAWSTSSWTLPATASLFTSQLPSQHGVSHYGAMLGADQTTLVQSLRAAGYRTGMWTANRVIAAGRGFARVFDHADFVLHPDFRKGPLVGEDAYGRGRDVVDRALEWVARARADEPGRPFFVYLHTMEPHIPYRCPEGADAACVEQSEQLAGRLLDLDWRVSASEAAAVRALYDAEVARMDRDLAALVRGLEALGVWESTWLVVTADHGELLGEFGMYMHGRTLHEDIVRVPLLVRPPGGRAGVVEAPVSLIDVAPTVLDAAGLPSPPSFTGRSLLAAVEGRGLAARPVVAELPMSTPDGDPLHKHVVAVSDGRAKYLMRTDGVLQRFDLRQDPGESRSLPAERGEFDALLQGAGLRYDASAYGERRMQAPTPEMREALQALGYLR